MSYQIYPSYSEENRFQVQNILKHLNEVFQKQLKIWRFDNKNDNLVSKKKNIVEDIKVFRSSKLLLCFVTSTYFETDALKFDLVLADSFRKQVVLLVIDDIPDDKLNQLRAYNSEFSFMNVSKQINFFESGCSGLFLKFIDNTDQSLEIFKYNSPYSSVYSCVPVYHFKCRYDPNDKNCVTNVYTRTDNIFVRKNKFIFEVLSKFQLYFSFREVLCLYLKLIGKQNTHCISQ